MSAQLGRENVHDLSPEEVARGLAEGKVLLVDVREPNETAVERYPDAVCVPLSEFDPSAIPDPAGRQVVFACQVGKRSITASLMAQAAGLPYDAHLAGGMLAWKASRTITGPAPGRLKVELCSSWAAVTIEQ